MQGSDGGTFAYDSFIPAHSRKKRRKNKGNTPTLCERLARVRKELEADAGWSPSCGEIVHRALHGAHISPREVLCLGLGSPSSSQSARAQLAFLIHLCTFLNIDSADVSVYDPVFTGADKDLFHNLGMRCLDHVQGAKHSLDCPTILYMPHCDLKLYEAVVRANWTLDRLCTLIFLSNRFSDYIDNNAASKLEKESPCLMRLVPFVECWPFPTSNAFPSAFNNISVQYVSKTPISLQDDAFWKKLPLSDQHA